ncbi:tRNA (guanosine(37)-N1)-methyltransferase TrmD [Ignatzschineria rhizosphaerae]|uniref:tRNA (guanine-N(1)-)-methyltransferase n=1 Tax=Ignatzschineria rhizosphaerae TaxID=2923279 RepID=A0ABY3X549_9GAMM|nr:tRNA (guanosine(37)-N1)-methyltransferase TrmD [Ignatzschineria rhizosphaerae]UNM95118.1 tRNA (guanosine(37)-N1)-methyltransferase TrmD [Ignatzschineria rhizosphaerae]
MKSKIVIDVIALIPEIILPIIEDGVVSRAHDRSLFELRFWNPRDYSLDNHHTVDARPFGGGPGMVMMYEPLKKAFDAIEAFRGSRGYRIYMSPQGGLFRQSMARSLVEETHLVILCGRYEGVDQRIIDHEIDLELSIGDYVLSGGELAAAVVIDAIVRLIPDAMSNEASHLNDSFSEGDLLDHPHYTRPREINGLKVPEVLFSGDHQKIAMWRQEQAHQKTILRKKRS